MPQVVIENPILNSPFAEPTRHFQFGERGITDEVTESLRVSSYFVPIPVSKKRGAQLSFDTEWTGERIRENDEINRQESFFVRHAYFLGADRPYENLQRALCAKINTAAWAELYSARRRPFAPPKSGHIAVKVINHYGNEVLKVVPLGKASASVPRE